MNKFIYLLILVLIFGCTNTPTIYQESGQPTIRKEINELINASGLLTNLGIKIVSLKTGSTLYELNSNSLFNPASNNKLYTHAAALATIDTNYTYSTNIYKDGETLYLVGGGDPDLTLSTLDSLALIVSNTNGQFNKLILDDSFHDDRRFGEGWMWDEGSWWYAAQISALSLNDNCVDFHVSPGNLGKIAKVINNPNTQYIDVINDSRTVNDTSNFKKFKIERDWKNQSNHFSISGFLMDTTSTDTIYRNVDDPTLFTGTVFNEMLNAKGMKIHNIEKGIRPDKAELVTTHQSEPIINSLENLMVESDNLTAELTIKLIGRQLSGSQGNWDNGLTGVKSFLNDEVGIDTTEFSMKDGSGISRYNYSSPNHFIRLLTWVYETPSIRNNFIQTLPKGGKNGTLSHRNFSKNVVAKTGSLSSVTSLSGFVFTQNGEPLAFSILMNGFSGSSAPYRKLQDQIVNILESL
ncbi:MAG: D-alanyl-D-alanine carboxypeptidase/D-alanyl-D-alanine-endopeptidase [Candidatus Marinimicrobia bacterium]|jgi:D-alanyl-D-alanine carboxypeptidase/D-alanyl-D-alanine-endopeptidase (penicillin-binding protein 4)|nr:D-alanyl-D-alanine carboxypeptidase/D-alanyl-D-alanine-endopeptidase [Candidatus Neomarinimicrobiota bacterium]MBT4067210.1 D-alanyl-D-alanine carboxypeptidase/D-alanyl-D-alanine-endopeptidase [Candidatus Neomarinimicrobiota bacterium]MBT4269986.1 D-alanyl-D-alanine carboxypeptidase/D-alanyl-D-alanine-endopeptidase [Candidatus Neomarinimicrobiota bacterium]MBT4371316.1 D-alanyl-D-alanine carboxypeptidase/D-alanyl-D-alanine-endopeptidase [Candidatus Neomarinimicrobiota bacterium]MBT4810114.1 